MEISKQAMIDHWKDRIRKGFEFHKLPDHMLDAVENYVLHGLMPGHFLQAVLTNDLKTAVCHADSMNLKRICEWVYFVINYVPADCQGSEGRFKEWLQAGGLLERNKKENEE